MRSDDIINELQCIGDMIDKIGEELGDYNLCSEAQTCSYNVYKLMKKIVVKNLKVGDEIITSDEIRAIVISKADNLSMINCIMPDDNGSYEPITLDVSLVTILKPTGKRFEIREVEES